MIMWHVQDKEVVSYVWVEYVYTSVAALTSTSVVNDVTRNHADRNTSPKGMLSSRRDAARRRAPLSTEWLQQRKALINYRTSRRFVKFSQKT